ncbi:MAG: hypothetical protein CMO74_00415 [Verrucomicrobiales bacterium]|nr:hypothetical protein [Verrucomicrobiales bacterium]|tara:strand:- start:219 stop:389 length:171 start_codon:yes stop_codon:yes gene_type:complete
MPSAYIQCTFCGQPAEVVLDDHEGEQNLVTDCDVCCRPMEIRALIANQEVVLIEQD